MFNILELSPNSIIIINHFRHQMYRPRYHIINFAVKNLKVFCDKVKQTGEHYISKTLLSHYRQIHLNFNLLDRKQKIILVFQSEFRSLLPK